MEALEAFEEDGLLKLSHTDSQVTSMGRFLSRNICMQCDAYVSHQHKTQAFSRLI
jgi:coproporphyrinogen III oxidase-like Fe-S oxidoreductase